MKTHLHFESFRVISKGVSVQMEWSVRIVGWERKRWWTGNVWILLERSEVNVTLASR